MIRVLGLTPGYNAPSARFRIRQFKEPLKQYGIDLQEAYAPIAYDRKLPGPLGKVRQRYILPLSAAFYAAKIASRLPQILRSKSFDLIWLNRAITDGVFLEKYLKHPLVFDVDDAIWMNGESHCKKIAQNASCIFAGNQHIASWFGQYNKNVQLIHTAIDADRFCPPASSKAVNRFDVVWSGSSQTEHYLLDIESSLNAFLQRHNEARLIIISNSWPAFKLIDPKKVEFCNWSPENEVEVLKRAQAGIMPLRNGEWEKGKCSFKMLQYMAVGLPVVVSPVGMNNDVLAKGNCGLSASSKDDWDGALEKLYYDAALRSALGKAGRAIVLEHFSTAVIGKKIADQFKKLLL